MEKDYKIVTRQIAVPANSSMNVELDCNSFVIKGINGWAYVNNMRLQYGYNNQLEVNGKEGERINQTLTIRTGNSDCLLYVMEKRMISYNKDYKLVFTCINKTTNFEVNCLDVILWNKSGMTVYVDNMPFNLNEQLKITANINERIKQTFYITTGGLPETELWIIQRI